MREAPSPSSSVLFDSDWPAGIGSIAFALTHHRVPDQRYGPNTAAVIYFLRADVMAATEASVQRITASAVTDPQHLARHEAKLLSTARRAGLEDAARHAFSDGAQLALSSINFGMNEQDQFFVSRPDGLEETFAWAAGLAATATALDPALSPSIAAGIRDPWLLASAATLRVANTNDEQWGAGGEPLGPPARLARCGRCGEPPAGYQATRAGGPFPLCKRHLEQEAASWADHPDGRAPILARYWAEPGEIPCQCECGCTRADGDTLMDPRYGLPFRCASCSRDQHPEPG